jgi:hypothetical protein
MMITHCQSSTGWFMGRGDWSWDRANVFERSIRGGAQKITEAVVSDGSGSMRVTWFSPYAARNLEIGEPIVLSGKVEQYLGRIVMNNPEWEAIDQQQLSTNRIVPVYPLTARITQKWLRHQIDQVLAYWVTGLPIPPCSHTPACGLLTIYCTRKFISKLGKIRRKHKNAWLLKKSSCSSSVIVKKSGRNVPPAVFRHDQWWKVELVVYHSL